MNLRFKINVENNLTLLPLASYFIIPWGYAAMNIASILLVVYALLNANKIKVIAKQIKKRHIFYTTLFAFYIAILTALTTVNPLGEKIFQLMLYLGVLPPLIYVCSILTKGNEPKLFNAFKLSVFLFCISSFVVLLINNATSAPSEMMGALTHKAFSTAIVNAHSPYYLSLLVLIAKAITLEELYKQKNKGLNTIIYLTLFLVLVLLSIRTALIAGIGMTLFYVYKAFNNYLQKVSAILLIIFLLAGVFSVNKVLQKRVANTMKTSINNLNWQEDWAYQGLALRYQIWDCAIYSLENNTIFGVGPAEVEQKIKNCSKEKKYHPLIWFNENRNAVFNAHNMYLEVTLMGGIIGALMFILMFWNIGLFIFKNSSLSQKHIFIIFAVFFITESILARNIGIILFSFFLFKPTTTNKTP